MKVGLLWFDDDPQRAIEEKVQRAAKRYREKFGRAANTCYVNPVSLRGDGLSENEFRCGRVRVIATPKVLPHHFWLGVADQSQEKKEQKKVQ
ncbi:MAG: hypothetical protein H8E90_07160 [Anaerolineales bacterium]|nr:hypothetical protein [Anaerolineales bacterium]